MILAAGRGARLRPITDTVPKPLVEVGGRSLLERHLDRLADAGIRRAVINLGWLGARIAERVGGGSDYGVAVSYSPETDGILDTGGGIRRALPMLGEAPFWVLNGDIHTDFALGPPDLGDGLVGHLVLVPRPPHRPRGDFDFEDGLVRNGADPAYTFAGLAIYRPAIVAAEAVTAFSIVPFLREAADAGRLSGEVHNGEWEDVGTPERLEALRARLG